MNPTSVLDSDRRCRLLQIFDVDDIGTDFVNVLLEHDGNSLHEATYIQSVGMNQPVPLIKLYRMTRLANGPQPDIASMIASGCNAVVFSGPGQGKSTLLKHLFLMQASNPVYLPMLFVLRTQGAVSLLAEIVQLIEKNRRFHKIPRTPDKLLILVDGYDEISVEQRQHVSGVLRRFINMRAGNFVLTCRTGYAVTDLLAQEYELAGFDSGDAVAFIDAFSQAMHFNIGAAEFVDELEKRGLSYIRSHPLMLTLACVVKTRSNPDLPNNAIELLRLAIETLAYRWDEGKGVTRSSRTGLFSHQLLDCMMKIAYESKSSKPATASVINIIAHHLSISRRTDIMPERVLDDIIGFYGLLVTTPDGYCQFAHKTLQDYLAARYKVERGLFSPRRVESWDLHAAYCACLSHDATQAFCVALQYSRSTEAIREILLNNGSFRPDVVASAVFDHFDRFRENYTLICTGSPRTYNVSSRSDFMSLADNVFLTAIMKKVRTARSVTGRSVVLAFCISEYVRRGLRFDRDDIEVIVLEFGSLESTLRVWRARVEHCFKVADVVSAVSNS